VKRLAAVFAHPDDETFATGGTIARYSAEGVRCSLYCATDGDAGRSSGIPVSSRAELGAMRRNELLAACQVLGIVSVEHGGHPDGGLQTVDPDRIIGEIVALLRRERPDVVVTFGPEGAPTQHRDHRAVSRLATAAFFLAGSPTAFPEQLGGGLTPHRPARLCYSTWRRPATGAELATEGQPIDIALPVGEWLGCKIEAFDAHRTQHQHRAHFESLALTDHEYYFVAAGAPVARRTDDLFGELTATAARA
jgi:LmbE family N-acetylglucosaminyl deacetylase